MKNLLTLVAAIAITSVASAQTECTFTTSECGTVTRTYDATRTRTVRTPTGVSITDRTTGEIIDTFDCEGNVRVQCGTAGVTSTPRPPRTPRTPFPTRPRTPSPVGTTTVTGSTSPGGTITSTETVTSTGGVNTATVTATGVARGN